MTPMIYIYFKLDNTPEEEVISLFQQIGYIYTDETAKLIPFPFVPSLMDWIYRRTSTKNDEPSLQFINLGLEHYIRTYAQTSDTAHRTWLFHLQCTNNVIAIDRPGKHTFHILQPDQVSQLFRSLAQAISTHIPSQLKYDDDHSRCTVTFQQGKALEEEYWKDEEDV